MWRKLAIVLSGATVMLAAGCMIGPLQENPVLIRPDPCVTVDNPVWITPGDYGRVFEKVIDIVDDYFEISYANRYDGWILTFPRIQPGYEQLWKAGNPNAYERLRATLQTIRDRAEIVIEPATDGGFFVKVTVYRELEDAPRPIRAMAGSAIFRTENNIERQFEVVDPTVIESNWIPLGRDTELEQLILQRLKTCL